MDKKIRDWGIFGFIVYLLSLPIMIWKSSKLGKIVSLYLTILLCLFVLNKFVDPIYKAYIKFQATKQADPMLKDLNNISQDIERLEKAVNESISGWNNLVSKRLEIADKKASEILTKKLEDNIKELDLIEKNIAVIKEEERTALKEKIYDFREKIKLQKKSIEEKDIRRECEQIASAVELLTKEEKDRLWSNLEEIGYEVKREKSAVTVIYSGNYGGEAYAFTTASTVSSGYFIGRRE